MQIQILCGLSLVFSEYTIKRVLIQRVLKIIKIYASV